MQIGHATIIAKDLVYYVMRKHLSSIIFQKVQHNAQWDGDFTSLNISFPPFLLVNVCAVSCQKLKTKTGVRKKGENSSTFLQYLFQLFLAQISAQQISLFPFKCVKSPYGFPLTTAFRWAKHKQHPRNEGCLRLKRECHYGRGKTSSFIIRNKLSETSSMECMRRSDSSFKGVVIKSTSANFFSFSTYFITPLSSSDKEQSTCAHTVDTKWNIQWGLPSPQMKRSWSRTRLLTTK